MALKFGEELEDVGHDDAELQALLAPTQQEEIQRDPEPVYEEPVGFEDRLFPDEPRPRPKPVTKALQKDIKGKVAMLLMVPGSMWAGRDEHCGGAFLDAIPDDVDAEGDATPGIASALTDIICDSPDMVKWFTTSGKYMKWFTLAMAVQPVLATAFHHHVTHAIQDTPQEQDFSQYVS